MEPGGHIDFIVLALIAAFILYRLYIVLGKKNGNEGVGSASNTARSAEGAETESVIAVIRERKAPVSRPEPAIKEPEIKDAIILGKIEGIKKIDPAFSPGKFLAGARMAYEMIIKAFSDGDRETLKNLTSEEIYKDFSKTLDEAAKENKKYVTTLVSLGPSNIINVDLKNSKASIEVNFESEQVHLTRDKDNNIIEGSPSQVAKISESWVFERDLRENNPNWLVVAT